MRCNYVCSIATIEPVDLIISQYAGFVGQETKRYLKEGGILLCNDSHGDATLALGFREPIINEADDWK